MPELEARGQFVQTLSCQRSKAAQTLVAQRRKKQTVVSPAGGSHAEPVLVAPGAKKPPCPWNDAREGVLTAAPRFATVSAS
eukprot:6483249-Amphidinium_carterae.1